MKLMDEVLSKDNLNLAYSRVVRNKGAAGVDEMTCEQVKEFLTATCKESRDTKTKWWSKKTRYSNSCR